MGDLWVPAIHLPHGKEVFKPLAYRPSVFKKILKGYAERALLHCRSADTVILPSRPDELYLRFLLERGLGTENIIVCAGKSDNFARDIISDDKAMDKISDVAEKSESVNFYIHLEEEYEIAKRIRRKKSVMHPSLTRMFNSMNFLTRLEEDMDLPRIERVQVRSSRFYDPAMALLEKYKKLFVRGNESCGGSHSYIIDGIEELKKTAKKISRNRYITRYFISRYIEASESWNVQYELGENNSVKYLGVIRQVLDRNCAHVGNSGGDSIPENVESCSKKIARRLSDMGARGTIGIGLIAVNGEVFPAEINARQNTSSPALSLFRKITGSSPAKKCVFETVSLPVPRDFTFRSFASRIGKELLFNPGEGRGVLPYHFEACRLTGNIDTVVFARDGKDLKTIKDKLVEI